MSKNWNHKTVLLGVALGGCLVLGMSTRTLALMSASECRNLRSQREEAIAKINSQAEIALEQLNPVIESDEFQKRLEERRQELEEQLNLLLKNEEKLNEAIEKDELRPEIREMLEDARNNPNAIAEFLDQQAEALPAVMRARVKQRQEELIEQVPSLPVECSIYK